jgi:hypothetical protein
MNPHPCSRTGVAPVSIIYLANAAKTIVCQTIEDFKNLINTIDPEKGCVLTVAAGTTAALLLTSVSAPVWMLSKKFLRVGRVR